MTQEQGPGYTLTMEEPRMRAIRLTESGMEEVKDLGIGALVTTEHALAALKEQYHLLLDGRLKGEYYYRLEEKYFREFCPDIKPLGLCEAERKEALEALRQALILLDDPYLGTEDFKQVQVNFALANALINKMAWRLV